MKGKEKKEKNRKEIKNQLMREENSEGVTDVLSPKNVGARHTDRFLVSILLFSEYVLTFYNNKIEK